MTGRLDPKLVAPEATAGLLELSRFVRSGTLDPKLIELVKIRASQMNRCAYCLALHLPRGRRFGLSEAQLDTLEAWRDSTVFSPQERAALAWTEAITALMDAGVPDAAWEAMRATFTDREIVDLTIAAVEINGWNRIQVAFQRPPRFEPSDPAGPAATTD